MIRVLAAVWMVALSGPSMALELCDELWFGRNLVFDQAGYCFGSPLGEEVFNNADCTTSAPVLSPVDQAYVAWVKETESEWQCNVDTSRTHIRVALPDLQHQLTDRVAASPYESACIGWGGPQITLYAGHSTGSEVLGYVHTGFDIHWDFEWLNAPAGWEFITVKSRTGVTHAMGWSHATILPAQCQMMAG